MKAHAKTAITAEMTADRASLVAAVKAAAAVTARKATIPILSCCRIAAGPGGIVVTGTDLDIEVARNASGSGYGTVVVPARTLHGFLAQTTGDEVRIIHSNGRAAFHAGGMALALTTYPADDFPDLVMPAPVGEIAFPEGSLPWLLAPVLPCISTEETRYYLNGVYLRRHEDRTLRAVASDGYRMSLRNLRLDADLPDLRMILPRTASPHILALAGDGEVVATFAWPTPTGEKRTVGATKYRDSYEADVMTNVPLRARFVTPGGHVTTKGIDGTFPNYTRIIPDVTDGYTVEIETAPFVRFLRAAMKMSRQKTKAVSISDDHGQPRVTHDHPGVGEIAATLPGSIRGVERVGFNARYLRDFAALCGPTMTIRGTNPTDPHIFVGRDAADVLVLMPMRV